MPRPASASTKSSAFPTPTESIAQATLPLPARTRLVGQALPDDVARALGRSDRSDTDAGERAQLRRQFQLVPDH